MTTTVPGGGPVAAQLLVLAKEPVPGRVKTRLTPPFSPVEAARLALASLEDTMDVVDEAVEDLADGGLVVEAVLVLDGQPWPGLSARWRVRIQGPGGLDERLAAAFAGARPLPAVLVGMDTPQLGSDLLVEAVRSVSEPQRGDACLGPAADGGWWLLGLRRPDPALLLGLPMSTSHTGAATAGRLQQAGLQVVPMPVLHDVDTIADATLVAEQVSPASRFATTFADLCRLAS